MKALDGPGMDRCEDTDMLKTQCAGICCQPRTRRSDPRVPSVDITARFRARFDSDCDICGELMHEGEPICRTFDGSYIHERHTEEWPDLHGFDPDDN